MMGQMFSTLKRREKKGKMRRGKERGKEKGGGERAKAAGLHISLVCTLYSPESAKLRHGRKPSVYTCILFRCCCVGVLDYVWVCNT